MTIRSRLNFKTAASALAVILCQCTSLPETPVPETSVSIVGAPDLAALMDVWWPAFTEFEPDLRRGPEWSFESDSLVIGALMFERADFAPISRRFTRAELGPYAHQFHGDMMKEPALFHVANRGSGPVFIATNRRPDSPLPEATNDFLAFVLGAEGQGLLEALPDFRPLSTDERVAQTAQLNGFVSGLDSALTPYMPRRGLRGEISSIGSDGMKALVDRWQRKFHKLQPGVVRGEQWEHLGTLNGFHALLAGETDLAPMGRELWPEELVAYQSVYGPGSQPVEIRVARGGFDTPQRTTAQAIFVHPDNPLEHINFDQLRSIFSDAQGPKTWGDLGLDGEWSDLPIEVRTPPQAAPNSVSLKLRLFPDGEWDPSAMEAGVDQTAAIVAARRGAISFGGFEDDMGRALKTLSVSENRIGPFIAASYETVSNGSYPFTRYMFIRLVRPVDGRFDPALVAFFRYIFSRQGQDDVRYSGYFPLTAAEAQTELEKIGAK
jgi:ABC-type phosphate transport system substrate-binding protein